MTGAMLSSPAIMMKPFSAWLNMWYSGVEPLVCSCVYWCVSFATGACFRCVVFVLFVRNCWANI